MEPYVAIAEVNDQGVTVYSSAQHPFMVRHDLKSVFNLPVSAGSLDRALCRRRLRQQVLHQDRTARRRLRLESQAARQATTDRRRSDADDAQRRCLDLDAHGGGRNGKIIARQAKIYHEHRRVRGKQPSGGRRKPPIAPSDRTHSQCSQIENVARYIQTPCRRALIAASAAPRSPCRGESQIDELAAKIGQDPLRVSFGQCGASQVKQFFPRMRPFDGNLGRISSLAAQALEWSKPLARGHGRSIALFGQRRRRIPA